MVLNLDSKVTDFLFWMAHEIGHSIAPSLCDQAAEDFADAFAQSLLFPQGEADALYGKLADAKKTSALPMILVTAKDWKERGVAQDGLLPCIVRVLVPKHEGQSSDF